MDLLVLYFLVKILLHALFTIQLAELLEFQCCLAYASLCGLVVLNKREYSNFLTNLMSRIRRLCLKSYLLKSSFQSAKETSK